MKRTLCLYIDAEVVAEAKKLAEELGISLSQLAAALIRRTKKTLPQQRQHSPQQQPTSQPPLPPPPPATATQPPPNAPAFLQNNVWVAALRSKGG